MSDPVLVLLAGPNGAGKSTFFARVVEPTIHLRFVNADAVELADETRVYDNSTAATPFRLVAQYRSGVLLGQARWPQWAPEALRGAGHRP